jgi:hypothetical protein
VEIESSTILKLLRSVKEIHVPTAEGIDIGHAGAFDCERVRTHLRCSDETIQAPAAIEE